MTVSIGRFVIHDIGGREAPYQSEGPPLLHGCGLVLCGAHMDAPRRRQADSLLTAKPSSIAGMAWLGYRQTMIAGHNPGTADLEGFAKILGDATRIRMLQLLMEGRALTAKELAYGAGVEPATATAHLRRLLEGGLVVVAAQGRHKYFRFASPHIAELMELLMVVAPRAKMKAPMPRIEEPLRRARMCYDHLAGELGIGITDGLVKQGLLRKEEDAFAVTKKGAAWFGELGVDLEKTRGKRRKFASQCLDWSERRDHLGGALGAALAERLIDLGWIARKRNSRAVGLTETGRRKLAEHFALHPEA